MARIRTVKPEFFRHESLFDAEQETGLPLRVAFIGLWTCADREGRFKWRPRALKTDCLPYDDVSMADVLDSLAEIGVVVRYECGGSEYGYIPSWRAHQVINNRESKSVLPSPDDPVGTRGPRVLSESKGKGKEGKGREHGREGNLPTKREIDTESLYQGETR